MLTEESFCSSTHPQGPQLIFSSMAWKQMPHLAAGFPTGDSGRGIWAGEAFLLLAGFLGPELFISTMSSSDNEVRSIKDSCSVLDSAHSQKTLAIRFQVNNTSSGWDLHMT